MRPFKNFKSDNSQSLNKDRSVYKHLINQIETSYPVNDWMYNGYHIWPVLRIRLFIMMIRQYEETRHNQSKRNGLLKEVPKKIISTYSAWFHYLKLSGKVNTLYCGAPSHRVDYLGKSYNRYFDHVMDKQSKRDLLIEHSATSKNNYYKPERVLLVSDVIKCFNLSSKINDYRGKENKYAQELNAILKSSGIEIENFITQTSRQITNVDRASKFFSKLLLKISPQKIYELCYYSTDMLGLNIAAHNLEIPTIDMQHGPQGPYHLAYGSWHQIPEEGYEVLPNEFHTWDESSASSIYEWAKNTCKHSVVVTGNPWVEGWKRGAFKSTDYRWPEKLILYSLQPTGDPLEPYLLETIRKTCHSWNWWLRLHPGQRAELDQIKDKLYEYNLLKKINIYDASKLLLPEILMHTKVHITKFSGCAIEAFNFGTPTIILDERGEDTFKDYLEYDIMSSYTGKISDTLVKKIKSYLA